MDSNQKDDLIKLFSKLLSRIFLSKFKNPPDSKTKFQLKEISEHSGHFDNALSKSTRSGENIKLITFLSYYKSYSDLAKRANSKPLNLDDLFTTDCQALLDMIIALKDFNSDEESCSAITYLIRNYSSVDDKLHQDSLLWQLRPEFEIIKNDSNFLEFKNIINALLSEMEE